MKFRAYGLKTVGHIDVGRIGWGDEPITLSRHGPCDNDRVPADDGVSRELPRVRRWE